MTSHFDINIDDLPENTVSDIIDNIIKNNHNNASYKYFKEVFADNNTIIDSDFNQPIIYRGFCKNTDAYKLWNKDNLHTFFGNNLIPFEDYDTYIHFFSHQTKSKTTHFTWDHFINNANHNRHYIGEVSIDDIDPHLNKYIFNPNNKTNIFETAIFCGFKHSGSTTHLHLSNDYLLNQIIGTKTLYFFNLNDNNHVGSIYFDPFTGDGKFFDHHSIDDFNITITDHTKLNLYKVVLHPGDSIAIPPWWFHNAHSDDFSLSFTNKSYRRNPYSYLFTYPILMLYIFTYFTCSSLSVHHIYFLFSNTRPHFLFSLILIIFTTIIKFSILTFLFIYIINFFYDNFLSFTNPYSFIPIFFSIILIHFIYTLLVDR